MALPSVELASQFLRSFRFSASTRLKEQLDRANPKPYVFEWIEDGVMGILHVNERYQGIVDTTPKALTEAVKGYVPRFRNLIALSEGHPTFEQGGLLVMTDEIVRPEPVGADPFPYIKDEDI